MDSKELIQHAEERSKRCSQHFVADSSKFLWGRRGGVRGGRGGGSMGDYFGGKVKGLLLGTIAAQKTATDLVASCAKLLKEDHGKCKGGIIHIWICTQPQSQGSGSISSPRTLALLETASNATVLQ